MQKRFSTHTLIIYVLCTAVIGLLLLVMYQVDRQWTKLAQMESSLAEQAKDMRALRSALSSGQLTAASQASDTTKEKVISPAFKRAYAATQQAEYAQGDWSVNAFATNLQTLTPFVSTDAYSSEVQSKIFESLIARDPETLEWIGKIAKSWDVSEDGLTITFKLRDDVTFSDGQPLTAEDVAFTYDFMMTEAIKAPRERAYYEKVKSVVAKDKYTVEFVFAEPYFEALSLAGGMDIMPKHFYEPYLKDADSAQAFNESKALLLGSGPYQLKDAKGWTPDQGGVELVRNERYWGEVQPSFDRLLWKIIQNDSARLTTFRNGGIDSYGAKAKEYQTLKDDQQIQEKSHHFEYMSPVVGYSYLAWNQEKEGKATIFADKRVRQAMTYLTDRERLIKDIHLGYAEPAISPFNPRSKQHNPKLSPRSYDLEKAKALLKEAGFSDTDGDGVLDKEGKPFEFKMVYFQSNDDTKRMVLFLKDLYAKAGVKMIPSPQEWPVMLEMLDKKNFDAITLGWTSGLETDIFQMFHSSQAKTNGDNFINYENKELDQLIDQARATVNEEERMPLWQQAEAIMYDDQPYTFLLRRKTLAFYDKRINNLGMTKVGLNSGFLPQEIYVPSTQQRYTQ